MPWKELVIAVVTGITASVATMLIGTLDYFNKSRELDIEMVRISLSILGGENRETSLPGRSFALRALKQYSNVDIPEDEFSKWAATGTIPDFSRLLISRAFTIDKDAGGDSDPTGQ